MGNEMSVIENLHPFLFNHAVVSIVRKKRSKFVANCKVISLAQDNLPLSS